MGAPIMGRAGRLLVGFRRRSRGKTVRASDRSRRPRRPGSKGRVVLPDGSIDGAAQRRRELRVVREHLFALYVRGFYLVGVDVGESVFERDTLSLPSLMN